MEVQLDKRYPLAVGVDQAWAVLADIHAVARCMPGAQITEQIDATHYKGTVKSKVGPAVMQFGGDIEVLGLDAAARTMQMLGKGADKSGSSASMNLKAHLEAGELSGGTAGSSVLVGVATIIVSGKLAQFGSRLLVPISDAMLAQFADNFRTAAAAVPMLVAETAAAKTSATVAAPAAAAAAAASAVAPTPTPAAARAAVPVHNVIAPAPVKELNAVALMWTVFKGWFAGLFSKQRA